jgi:voltage-gated potassium channel
VFRILKLAQYVGEAGILLDALRASRYKITVFLVTVVSATVCVGSVMFLVEGPEHGFANIPTSVYWAIVTLTTVGFGDITPQTPLGQFIASFIMILGYGIIAVPTGIVSAEIAWAARRKATDDLAPPLPGAPGRCTHCGRATHAPDARYCAGCGSSLQG